MPKQELLYCSFCRRDSDHVAKLIAGPGVYICDACIAKCNQILAEEPTPPFRGWASLSVEELLRGLRASEVAVDGVRDVLQEQIDLLREHGVSWTRIGDALGISRQAAWERFA